MTPWSADKNKTNHLCWQQGMHIYKGNGILVGRECWGNVEYWYKYGGLFGCWIILHVPPLLQQIHTHKCVCYTRSVTFTCDATLVMFICRDHVTPAPPVGLRVKGKNGRENWNNAGSFIQRQTAQNITTGLFFFISMDWLEYISDWFEFDCKIYKSFFVSNKQFFIRTSVWFTF